MVSLLNILLLAVSLGLPTPALAAMPAVLSAGQTVKNDQTVKKAKGIWIDVRSQEEFNEGHLNDAVNIPVDQISQRIQTLSPNKNAPINLYCRSGRRAETALQTLKQMGYTNVTNHGGYQDLINQGIR